METYWSVLTHTQAENSTRANEAINTKLFCQQPQKTNLDSTYQA